MPVLGSLALAIGYAVVMGWILKYTVGAFTGETLAPADVDGFSAQFGQMASSFGNNFWQVAGLVLVAVILIAGIGAGIEKVNKIMMPLFFSDVCRAGGVHGLSAGRGGGLPVYVYRG